MVDVFRSCKLSNQIAIEREEKVLIPVKLTLSLAETAEVVRSKSVKGVRRRKESIWQNR